MSVQKIKCFFGFHEWQMTEAGRKWMDWTLSQRDCEIHVSVQHECKHCGKKEKKGMGVFHL